jgi:membrane peptidoglycan carboxypeptidase
MKRFLVAVLKWCVKWTLIFSALASLGGWWAYQRWVVEDPGPAYSRQGILAIIAQESPVTYRDGSTRIGTFFDTEHRSFTPWSDIPEDWTNAIVASEDGGFWNHHGFSVPHMVWAAARNALAGKVVAGGSTLTQQTAKNLFYRPDRSYRSKLTELLNALRLEAHFSKEEILEFYANQFHVSANGRGLGIAARYFFDKTPAQLTRKECAFLAGLVKAPNRYNPFIGETEERRERARAAAEARTAYVLRRRVEEGTLDADEAERLVAEPLVFKRGTFQYERSVLVDEVERRLEDPSVVAVFETLGIDNPATAGIRVVTTLDASAQRGAQYAVVHHLTELGGSLERLGPAALRLPDDARTLQDTGQVLQALTIQAARVTTATARVVTLDVGGRACTVDAAGIQRVAKTFAGGDTAALVAALPAGTRVLASVRTGGTAPVCDLEARVGLQGAAIVLEDGRVRAMVGGAENRGFNRATQARRQLGSTWKPLVYAAALQLGWLPSDILDNRRNAFPFRGVWYFPGADHASDAWLSMSLAGARSENLASVWLLAHMVDRLNGEQLRRVAEQAGVFGKPDEAPDAWRARLQKEGIQPGPARLDALAFTRAKESVLSGMAFAAHPEDALAVRSLVYGAGWSEERARLQRVSDAGERAARLAALERTFLGLEAALAEVPMPIEPTEDPLVGGGLHASTLRDLRAATDRARAELEGRDPWDPELLLLDPDVRVLLGIRYLQTQVAATGVSVELPTNLTVALGGADLALADMALLYQVLLRGEAWTFEGVDADGDTTVERLATDGPGPALGLIDRIESVDGTVLWRANATARKVADPVGGALVGDILRNVVRQGTGRRAEGAVVLGGQPLPLAGKTGTTNEYRNAAFVGFAPRTSASGLIWGDAFTVATWVGYDDNRPMRRGSLRVQGANGALPAWIGIVRSLADAGLLGPGGVSEWTPPEGLARLPIEAGTGLPRTDAAAEGPTLLTTVDEARRYGAFAEPVVAPADAAALLLPPPAEGPGAELGPDAREEGVDAATTGASPPQAVPDEVPPPAVPPG